MLVEKIIAQKNENQCLKFSREIFAKNDMIQKILFNTFQTGPNKKKNAPPWTRSGGCGA